MSVLISGALTDGAGIPMSGCHIIMKSRVNTSEVVMRTIADVVTGSNGEYSFEAQEGKYCVYLKQDWCDECCVGDIAVYDDSKPGTLNDFLTAPDEGDLKPDVVKRFEEMVAQAQQSAEAAAESERQAGQHAAEAQKIKEDCQTLADNVQQNAEAVTEDKKQVETLASSAAQDAARAEQAKADTDRIVNKAVDKLGEAATLAGEVKASAEAAARSEQNAKSHADNAAGNAQQTAQDVTATAAARDEAEHLAEAARQDAAATAEDRKNTAEDVKTTEASAASAAQSAQDAADSARAAEQARTDIDVTLAGTLKTNNHLSEIAAAGEDAQQGARDNLGLKAAAIMAPQSDIHDRTEGRLAVPGMYGFGKIHLLQEMVEFKTEAEFLQWAKNAKPGRYNVHAYDNVLISDISFYGVIEVIWPESQIDLNIFPYGASKIIIFYGLGGHIYYNRYIGGANGHLTGWENMKVDEASVRAQIETRAPLDSPAFTGTPTTPTPPDDAAGMEMANAAFVRKLIAALVDSSPEALDTLNELAEALNKDPNFATTMTKALAGKQPLNDSLTSLSGLVTEGNKLPYFSDKNIMALANLSAVGRMLIGQNSQDDVVNYLGINGVNYCRFRGELPPDVNINTFGPDAEVVGVWVKNTNSGATTENGFPEDNCQGILEIFIGGAYSCTQRFTTSRGNVYVRSLAGKWSGNGPWPVWKTVGFQPVRMDYSGDLNNLTEPGIYSTTELATNVPLSTANGAACPGVVEVICRSSAKSVIQRYTSMTATTGLSNRVYHRTQSGAFWADWREVLDDELVADAVAKTLGAGNEYGDPRSGGIILAAYQGETDGDGHITVERGKTYRGSRLGPVSVECGFNPASVSTYTPRFNIMGCNRHPLPGSYIALSGFPDTYSENAFIALFVRIV